MEEKCVEEGMKLARWLLILGTRGTSVANASYEDYQRLSREAGEALKEVDKMTCLSQPERSVLASELTYLKDQAEKVNFLYTSDAGSRLLYLLSNPQHYIESYKPESLTYLEITYAGDTVLTVGSLVSKETLERENERVRELGLKPATGRGKS